MPQNVARKRPSIPSSPPESSPPGARAVVGFGAQLETGAMGDADEFGGGGGGGFDKSVVPAEPVIHQPAHGFDNGPPAGAAVVGVGGAATALGY